MWNMKNALIGKNVEEWGPRFPDISKQTDSILYTTFKEIWKVGASKWVGKNRRRVEWAGCDVGE